jgi:hypothetical protein
MDIKDIDKNLTKEEKANVDKIVAHLKDKGNYTHSALQEESLRAKLSMLPHACPCEICNKVRDRKQVESFSFQQVAVVKHEKFSEDNLLFVIAPFKHMSNEEFLMSPLWGIAGRLFPIMKSVYTSLYGKLNGFVIDVNNSYDNNYREHACINVKFIKKT